MFLTESITNVKASTSEFYILKNMSSKNRSKMFFRNIKDERIKKNLDYKKS